MSLVHPVARARGHGSARSGVQHWWMQRLSAIALAPLTLWLVYVLATVGAGDFGAVRGWLGDPLHAALVIAWVVSMLYHAQLGLQVVIEDYVHVPWQELGLLVAVKLLAALGAVIAVLSVLRVLFGD